MVSVNFRMNYGIKKEDILNFLKNIGYEHIGNNNSSIWINAANSTLELSDELSCIMSSIFDVESPLLPLKICCNNIGSNDIFISSFNTLYPFNQIALPVLLPIHRQRLRHIFHRTRLRCHHLLFHPVNF